MTAATPSLQPDQEAAADAVDGVGSYRQILRSSALIGGASALNLAVGIVRTKALAVLIGPAGIGLLGIFSSVADLTRSIAQLGINASGVRQIAEAMGSNDGHRIARTIMVLRRVAVTLGLLGAVALIVLCRQVSQWAFGSEQHAASIAWLSLAVLFRLVGDAQAAMLQGMRRIAEIAKIGVFGALAGALVSIVLAALMGENGVVPGLIATAAASTLISTWYARKVRVEPVRMSRPEVRQEAASLLKLGLAFMASALLTTGAAFAVRAIVLRDGGVGAAGMFQAAWTLGGMYVGFVLQAMGTDFYPRLVSAIGDREHANRLVNEQAQVSLLLAGPGVIATLVLAGPVVVAFYSTEFTAAIDALRWICMGMALRVITWPMGYLVVANNRRIVFFATELAWTVVNVALSWVCVAQFGLIGAGIAFFASYVFHAVMIYTVVSRMHGFEWSTQTWRHGLIFVVSVGSSFAAFCVLPANEATMVGGVVLLVSTLHTARALFSMAPEVVPKALRAILLRRTQHQGERR
jgi:enterobacterial common antigen flippase